MLVNVLDTVIDTDAIAFTTQIKQRDTKLYWDINNKEYAYITEYVFKIGLMTGDFIIMNSSDYNKILSAKNKIDKCLMS